MASLTDTLRLIAAAREGDPLAPVSVIVPSHIAGLQLRRRLTQYGPFGNVRFETLPRIAEVLGAARLASSGRLPLAAGLERARGATRRAGAGEARR